MAAPTDIVDRVKRNPAHGVTFHQQIDAFLDEFTRREHDRQTALDALHRYIRTHPETEHNLDLQTVLLSLL